jgi:hypothetical protein
VTVTELETVQEHLLTKNIGSDLDETSVKTENSAKKIRGNILANIDKLYEQQ